MLWENNMKRKWQRSLRELEDGLGESDFFAGCSIVLFLGSLVGVLILMGAIRYLTNS